MLQIFTKCSMDTIGDPDIRFEKDVTCNYCNYALSRLNNVYFSDERGQKKLNTMLTSSEKEAKGINIIV